MKKWTWILNIGRWKYTYGTTSNFTEEDILHAFSLKKEARNIENEEIEHEPITDTKKLTYSSKLIKVLAVLKSGV